LLADNGHSKVDLLRSAVQFRFYLPSRVLFIYQPMFSHLYGWKESLGTNRWSLTHLLMVGRWFESLENRLNLTVYSFLSTGGPVNSWQGTKTQVVLTYLFSDYVEGKLHYTDYSGESEDIYGQYDLWDNVGWEMLYKF
jgi:hypothetical protein